MARTQLQKEKQKAYDRNRYYDRKSKGLCHICGNPVAKNSATRCYHCWFSKICIDRTGSSVLARQIETLFYQQGGRCAYTNEPIQLGDGAQLDHKIPLQRGGTNTIDNLHWVAAHVNLMKGRRTHEEFVALCALIANRHDI